MIAMRARSTPPMAVPLIITILVTACIPATSGRPGSTAFGEGASPSVALATPIATPAGPSGRPSFARPTPTPQPTFLTYVVKHGDTLTSIARAHGTTARSIAFWNRAQYPSLDPESASYSPNRIEVGWILLLVPNMELDPEDLPPGPAPTPRSTPSST
jgi:LysM domain-containing protein